MKKTVYPAFLICLALLACMLILAACDSLVIQIPADTTNAADNTTEQTQDTQEPVHQHAFGEWSISKDPTCTEPGQKQRVCACGESETEILEALPHTEVEIKGFPATCTESGLSDGAYCSVCQQTLTQQIVLEALGHTEVDEGYNPPSCTLEGWTGGTVCAVCKTRMKPRETIPATGHEYSHTVTVTDPTCTKPGYTTNRCHCGASVQDNPTEALGHQFGDWYTYYKPTCTSEGLNHRDCERCDHIDKQEVPRLGHAYSLTVYPPSCTLEGYTLYACNNCSDTYTDDYTSALGHTYTVVVTQPGCLTQGFTTHTCHCGDTYTDTYTSPLGHHHTAFTVQPTCNDQGYTVYTCHCGDSYYSDYTSPLGHRLGQAYYTVTPTCTEQGQERKNCQFCLYYEEYYVSPFGHSWEQVVTAPTCTEQGYTSRVCHCGHSYIESYQPAFGHAYTVTVQSPTCTEQGYTTHTCHCGDSYVDSYTYPIGHSYTSVTSQPTCTEPGYITNTCQNCGDSYATVHRNPHGHRYGMAHTEKPVTCTEDGLETRTCDYCGQVLETVIPATGHIYASVVTQPTCTEQGYTTHACGKCSDIYVDAYLDPIGHSYTSITTDPTCTKQGYTTHSCENCSDTFKDSYTEALGHSYTDWVVQIPVTCTESGRESRYCTLCEKSELNVIPATGHDYQAVITAPTCLDQGYTTYTCQNCSKSYVGDYTNRISHVWGEWQLEKEPTCTQSGNNIRYCEACNGRQTSAIASLGHDYSESTVTPPTCMKQGFTTHACSRCGHTYKDTYTAAVAHDFVLTSVPPTCTEDGYTSNICTMCGGGGTSYDAPALGHDYVATVIEPGCMTNGYTVYDCTRCEDYYHADHTYATGHVSEDIPPIEPTFTTNGWIGGKRCAVCGMQLEAQTEVGMYRHIYVEYNEAAVIVNAPDKASFGTYITITATPKPGYEFEGWYIGDVLICQTPAYTFQVGIDEYTYTARAKNANAWDGTVGNGFAGGSGTEADPYLISNGWELAYLAYQINYGASAQYNNKYYALTNDIDLNGINWDPIGCIYNSSGKADMSKAFIGHFDGCGYTVYNLTINRSKYNFYRFFGLFGVVEAGGYIEDVHIRNCNIEFYNDGAKQLNCGGLAGRIVNTTVTRCSVEGNISVASGYETAPILVGGLVGNAYDGAWISDCYTAGDVYGSNIGLQSGQEGKVGGIAGGIENSTLTRCYSTCYVYAKSVQYAISGGLVGHMYGSGSSSTNVYDNLSLASGKADNYGGWYTYSGKIYGYKSVGNDFDNHTAKTDTVEFYTSTLGWSADVWDFDGVTEGKLPELKR